MIQTYKDKNDTNELIYQTDSEFENKLWLPQGQREQGYVRSLGLADTQYHRKNR